MMESNLFAFPQPLLLTILFPILLSRVETLFITTFLLSLSLLFRLFRF
jgi:hypothetical protein